MPYAKIKKRINLFLAMAAVLTTVILFQVFETPAGKLERVVADKNIKFYQIKVRNTPLLVEIARTSAEHRQGLSGRASLGEFQGMLFVFSGDTKPTFWMKEMNFPIDIFWVDRHLRVVEITTNISPATFPQIFSPKRPVRYVLEVNAGLADAFNIQSGDWLAI